MDNKKVKKAGAFAAPLKIKLIITLAVLLVLSAVAFGLTPVKSGFVKADGETEETGGELVINGDLEKGSEGADYFAFYVEKGISEGTDVTLSYAVGEGVGGSNAVKAIKTDPKLNAQVVLLTGDWINVEANSTYVLSYWVKMENCSGMTVFSMFHTDIGGWNYNEENITSTNNGWIKVRRKIQTEAAQKLTIYLFFQGMGKGTVRFDNISLVKFEQGSNLIFNGEFDDLNTDGTPEEWNFWTTASGSEVQKDFSFTVVSGDESRNGSSLKVVNLSLSDKRGVLNTNRFAMEGGKTYRFSYYYRTESTSATTAICLRQFKANGNGTDNNSYFWENSATVTGMTDGGKWKRVDAVFTAEPDAAYGMMQIDVKPTGEKGAYYDSFTFELLDNIEFNPGFERVSGDSLTGWLVTNADEISFDDEVFYDGESSIHLIRDSYTSDYTLRSIGTTPVMSAKSYDIGFKVKSQNSKDVKASISVDIYNTQKQMTSTITSPYFFLKSGEGYSEWTSVWMRYVMPADSAELRWMIKFSAGVTDCYIDGGFIKESGNTIYVEDFESVSSDGLAAGWTGSPENYKDGKLVLGANDEVSTVLSSALYAFGYTFTGEYTAENGAVPQLKIEWYSSADKKVSEKTYTIAGDGTFSVEFIQPSCAYAKLCFANAGEGTVTFDNLKIEKTYDPAAAKLGWSGQWVCYPYVDVAYGGEYKTTYFRKSFTTTEKAVSAIIQLTGDDNVTTFVNGKEIDDPGKNSWAKVLVADVTEHIHLGENVLAFQVKNNTYYSGLLFDLEIVYESGKKERVYSDNTLPTSETAPSGWKNAGFDDSGWKTSYFIGFVSCMPWGVLNYKKSTDLLPSITFDAVSVTEQARGGTYIQFSAEMSSEKAISDDLTFTVNFRDKYAADEDEVIGAWVTPTLIKGVPTSQWEPGVKYNMVFSIFVPDYLVSGSYMLQFDSDEFDITNRDYFGNILRGAYVKLSAGEIKLTESKVERIDGVTRLVIDGEPVAPMMYLREQKTVFETEYASGMLDAGVQLICLPNCYSYNMNSSGAVWQGYNKYDFSIIDDMVYETLQGAPTAKLMFMLSADPPWWWMRANPDTVPVDNKGNSVSAKPSVTYASKKWREDTAKYFRDLLAYVMKQPYAGHIYSVKIAAGDTFEWQYYSQLLNSCADFSKVALTEFRAWLTEKYGTDEALRAAWGDNNVTLATATVPTWEERTPTTYKTLLDGKTQRNVIDFHLFMCRVTTDSILYFADVVKEATGRKWIVGTYNGYLSIALTYESTNIVNAYISEILKSDSIDFLCAPVCYDERRIGMSASYMMMVDSVLAAGKLAIIECDSRTVYFDSKSTQPFVLGEWGKTYTLRDTLEAMKRDFSNMMIKGAGLWWYDMYGGWFNDPEIYSLIKTMSKEWKYSVDHPSQNTSEIAYIVGDDLVTTMAYDFDATYDYLYQALYNQKESLAHIGTSYDMLYLSDFKKGLHKEYSVYLIVATNVDEETQAAIKAQACKAGKTVIWVGAPGIYGEDGSMSAEYVSDLVGINLAFAPEGTSYAIKVNGDNGLIAGLNGYIYGKASSTHVRPTLYSIDENATVLGNLYGTELGGLAVKEISCEGGSWTSVYSAVGNVPEELMRNALKKMGEKLVETENDVVYKNQNYVSLSSPYGGSKTVKLDRKTDVYDVFKGEWIALGVDELTIETEAGSCVLLRLGDHTKPTYDEDKKPDDKKDDDYLTPSCKGCKGCGGSLSGDLFTLSLAAIAVITVTLVRRKKYGDK